MNWAKVWAIARHEYMTNVRRWGFIIMTAIVPLLGVGLLAFSALSGRIAVEQIMKQFLPSTNRIGVVDEGGLITQILPEFQEGFVLYPDVEAAKQDADAGKLVAVILLPKDYVQTGRVYGYAKNGDIFLSVLEDSNRLDRFLSAHLAAPYVPPHVLARLEKPVTDLVPLEKGQTAESPLKSFGDIFLPYLLGMLLIISIFFSSGYLIQGVAAEKENRLVEIVLSSVNAFEWFMGKVLGLGALGLTQVLIWLLTVLLLTGGGGALVLMFLPSLPWYIWGLMFLYYLSGYLLFATLYAGLAALGTNVRESQQVAGVVSFLAALPLMFSGVLFTSPNGLIARVLSYIPLTAPGMMLLRLSMTSPPWRDILISLAGIFLFIPVNLWLGAKLFRMGILMYGQRPSIRQVWRALRTA